MSFGSAMRFEVGAAQGKPSIFWDQGKEPQKTRKFGYKNKDLRHPLRDSEKDVYIEQVAVYRHDVRLPSTQPPAQKSDTAEQKVQPKPPRPGKDFIRRNRDKFGTTKKSDRADKNKKEHPMANTVTLTQDQLNAILASVGKITSGKDNALRISIDNDKNEIQIVSPREEKKDGEKEEEKDKKSSGEKEGSEEGKEKQDTEEEGNIFSLISEAEKGQNDGHSRKRRAHKDQREKRKETSKSEEASDKKSNSGDSKSDKHLDLELPHKDEGEDNKTAENVLYYESPRISMKHLTVAEKKRLQWARERAELEKNYDPWGRPGAGAPLRNQSGQVLADYTTRKDDLKKSLEDISMKYLGSVSDDKAEKKSHDTTEKTDDEPSKVAKEDKKSPRTEKQEKTSGVVFVTDEEKGKDSKNNEKKKWLEELEKQREEQRQKKLKSKHRDQGVDDTWADRFSTHKPAPLPKQDKAILLEKKPAPESSAHQPDQSATSQQHAAIRSSFVIGQAAPSDERFAVTKEQEKRRWLEDLERQIEEKRLQKLKEKEQNTLGDTWADRFTQHIPPPTVSHAAGLLNTNQSALDKDHTDSAPQESGRISSAPQPQVKNENDEHTFLRGQNVALDPITQKEQEVKRQRYLEHQEAIRLQIEEKQRLKREERERKIREEMEEEAKLKHERDSLQEQFLSEQQKIRQKEEARQRRVNELKMAMDEAQDKAQQEKLIRRMEHLRQGGHDISHLQAHLEAISPRVSMPEPPQVPALNLTTRQGYQPNTGQQLSQISSRTVDIPAPVVTHDQYIENRVLTPSLPRSDETDVKREFSEVDIEYKEPKKKVRPPVQGKRVRVKSATQEVKKELKNERRREKLKPGERDKWNYQNKQRIKPVKQSEKDPFYERRRQQSEERRAKRERELLALVELNKPIIPSEKPLSHRSRDSSPAKEEHVYRDNKGHEGRSPSPDRHDGVRHQRQKSASPNRSTERRRGHLPGRGRSPVRRGTSNSPVQSYRASQQSRSPPVPALKHRREVGRGERAQILRVEDDNDYDNEYNNDAYNYSNYQPTTGKPRHPQGHYQDRNPIDVPLDDGDFVPFTRTTEILDPSRAVEPLQMSRENTRVQKGRKAYVENHNPANYGNRLDNIRDGSTKSDPILNPELVKAHPTARQDLILQQLSTLKQSLMQRQRELETCMSPSDFDHGAE